MVFFNNEECQLLVFRDITANKNLELERNKVSMMKMLHATVSHDMMNPINTIQMFADSLLNHGI